MITITILSAAIVAIAVVGTVATLRAGIAREEADHSLRGTPTTLASSVTRRMVGLYVRMPQQTQPTPRKTEAARSPWPSDHYWPGDSAD